MLHQLDHMPTELLNCHPTALHTFLPGPTLLHLPGRKQQPLFISVLQHGNEHTGLLAVQALLQKYHGIALPRPVSIFLGNLSAARHGLRRLDNQPDYNRIWPGASQEMLDYPEARMMRQIVEIMARRDVFASVDVHNNTGFNPHYACVNVLDHKYLQLATLFSRTVVYFIRPRGVQSMAFAKICPAVTLECGKPGEPHGMQHAIEYLDACLHLSEIPSHPVAEHDISLFHTVAQIKIRDDISFSFNQEDTDVVFSDDIDRLNFRELSKGTRLGTVNTDRKALTAEDEHGNEVTHRYIDCIDDDLILTRTVMPSMLTLDERIIRQDCLCYFMERLDLGEVPVPP
jgi:succinylglutamate desuccinylase